MNIFVDFILRYLSLVLASITSTIFVAIIGWILVKHMVNKDDSKSFLPLFFLPLFLVTHRSFHPV